MKKIAWLAVIAGGVANMILSNVFTMPVALYVIGTYGMAGMAQSQAISGYLATLHAHPGLYALAVLCGALASLCAGIVTAFLAKHDRVLNGALSAWACVALDIYGLMTHTSNDGLLFEILLMPVAPALGTLGGYLVVRRLSFGFASLRSR